MLLISRSRRRVLHVPFFMLGAGLVLATGGVILLLKGVSVQSVVGVAFGAAVLLIAAGSIRVIRRRDEALEIASFVSRESFDASCCAFGFTTSHGESGLSYDIYVTDGTRQAEVGDSLFLRPSQALLDDLQQTLLAGATAAIVPVAEAYRAPAAETRDERSSRARTRVDAERKSTVDEETAVKARVDAYYRSPGARRTIFIVVVVAVVYVLGMFAFSYRRPG